MGRIKRIARTRVWEAHRASIQDEGNPENWPICPLCERPIPPAQQDAHHLIPKSRGGRDTQVMHRICHRQIHALFTETQLARQYSTAEALLAVPAMQKFVEWIRSKPLDYYSRSYKSHIKYQAK